MHSIQQNANTNRRKMRVNELVPLQSFLVWTKRILPRFISVFLVGGSTDRFYKKKVSNIKVWIVKFALILLLAHRDPSGAQLVGKHRFVCD